jgi:hypothetical protein
MYDSALELIRKRFTPQALRDAIQATYKDGKVVSATQAKIEDEFEDAKGYVPWVDITHGMEALEHLEYEQEIWGHVSLLDPYPAQMPSISMKSSHSNPLGLGAQMPPCTPPRIQCHLRAQRLNCRTRTK